MFKWLFGKKEVALIKEETKKGFDFVKKDISAVGEWIKHLDSEKNLHKKDMEEIREILSSVQEEIIELKNMFSIMNELKPNRLFKHPTVVQ